MSTMKWHIVQSFNPKKVWIRDEHGAKLSPLISLKAAKTLCNDHNIIVDYLKEKA